MTIRRCRLSAFLSAVILLIYTFAVFAVKAGDTSTVPGYKLVNTYDETKGIVTSEVYLTDGLGLVGQFGLCYNTELVTLAVPLTDGRIITEYEEQMASGKLKITHFVTADNKCVITNETNKLHDLINEETGEFFLAWYAPSSVKLDATSEDKRIATVTFKVNDGVTAQDIERAGNDVIRFSSHTPSDTNVVGYSSGAYCANEDNTPVRNNGRTKYSITLLTEYVGLSIPGGFDITLKENDNGITIPATHGTSKRIMPVPLNTQSSEIRSVLTLPLNMAAVIQTRDGEVSPEIVKTGDTITLTKGNMKETIVIAAKSDTDGDGNVTMADLNTMMRVISGDLENAPEEALYTVDTNGDRVLSDEEYGGFISDIIETNK